jgi:GPH family glycoside/pentoside/hexuronide:cation symporter
MAKQEHHQTRPEDKVSVSGKISYGFGMTAYAMMVQSLGQMATVVFNIGLGVNPVYIGWIMGVSRVWDAITDPIMGNITDNTRSRWGRRRPWIALGGLLSGLSFAAIWLFPRGMSEMFYVGWFLITSLIFFVAFTMFSVPYAALGMELSPDHHERTSVIAYRSVMAQGGGLACASLFWFSSLPRFQGVADGMRAAGIIMGVLIFVLAIIPAVFSKEHPSLVERQSKKPAPSTSLLSSAKATLGHSPFLILIAVTALLLIGTMMVNHLGAYICIYHVFGGDNSPECGKVLTMSGWASRIATVVAIPLLTMISKRIGKRKTLLLAMIFSLCGTLLKWICYDPAHPYLQLIPSIMIGPALGGVWMLVNAMIPDVVDLDELKTGNRCEGMFSAVYGWMFKMGAALALIVSGYVLNWSGFDAALPAQTGQSIFMMRVYFTALPSLAIGAAIAAMWFYPLTEKRSYEVRQEIERKRMS